MIAARQVVDLRPQLERLDRLILRSEGIEPSSLTFAFRPLWQVDAAAAAGMALTVAGATSLMHEAVVDVVTVPKLSEHLSSADTTAQLSARFAYAAAMKSINNLLLLGDGESWAQHSTPAPTSKPQLRRHYHVDS